MPNLTPPPAGTTSPDLYEPVKVTQSGVPLTVDDPIQYVPPPLETLTYDADGNLKTDGRWTYTWDAADRLVRMESTAFTQPASTTPPLLAVTVPARVIEFAYDGLSRRIRKKVTEGGSSIVLWEAYVYDGWNMVLSVKLNPAAGASQGRPQSAIASYVWGPDLGSKPFARRDWQAAGGVRGLILANYFTGANGGGLHAPGMDAMGNVTSVTRLGVASTYGGPYFRSEFVYDYDAFGKEMRSSTLVAGLNPDSFPFHYSTKFTDPESGFNYYGYRFYDPANGRWINRDPVMELGGLNLFSMLPANGLVNFDYLGLCKRSQAPSPAGHHIVPFDVFKDCPDDSVVCQVLNAADNLMRDDDYNTHNGKSLGGVTAPEYSKLVKGIVATALSGKNICGCDNKELKNIIAKVKGAGGDVKKYLEGVEAEIAAAKRARMLARAAEAAEKAAEFAKKAGKVLVVVEVATDIANGATSEEVGINALMNISGGDIAKDVIENNPLSEVGRNAFDKYFRQIEEATNLDQ